MIKFQEISADGHLNAEFAKKLLATALEFGQTVNLSIFELKVSGFNKQFFDEIESKDFFIYREPRNFSPILVSPKVLRVPTICIKGKITQESKDFLLSKDIIGRVGGEVLSITVREMSEKEKDSYCVSEWKYGGRKCWFRLSTDYALFGNISMKRLNDFSARLSKLGRVRLFFNPEINMLNFRVGGNEEKPYLGEHKIGSIAEFIKLKSLTTIQVSNFTKNELSKIRKRNFDRAILELLRSRGSNDSRDN